MAKEGTVQVKALVCNWCDAILVHDDDTFDSCKAAMRAHDFECPQSPVGVYRRERDKANNTLRTIWDYFVVGEEEEAKRVLEAYMNERREE